MALAFTIGFSFVLLFFLDWQALFSCDSEESCRAVSLIFEQPFSSMGLRRSSLLVCFILFMAYWVSNAVAAAHNIRDAAEISTYYKDRLGIVSDALLATMEWSEVVSRLIEQQRKLPVCIVQDDLTALEIANVIMREDNYMIALTNHHAFTSRLPPWIPHRLVYTRSVLWNLRTAIFRWFFDSRGRVCREFLDCPDSLAQRLRFMGLINLLLVVPVLVFVTIYFFMRHAEEFRSHRASPFRRQWSDYAQWTFREFNELPHQFSARMLRAQAAAEAYVESTRTPSPVLNALRRCVRYVSGSILAVLLIVAVWDDTLLLFVKVQDKNLLWYIALFGFVFAVADSAGDGERPVSQESNAPLHMHSAMMRLVRCTHFLPPTWRTPAPPSTLAAGLGTGVAGGTERARFCRHFQHIRSQFLRSYFVHRIQVLTEELLGVILTPLLLIVYLPQAAPDVVDVVRRARHPSPNLGDWCSFGCLDPRKNGSEFYGAGLRLGVRSVGVLDGTIVQHGQSGIISNGGKLEKSAISFILSHRSACPLREGNRTRGVQEAPRLTASEPRAASARELTITIPMQDLGSSREEFASPRDMTENSDGSQGDLTESEMRAPSIDTWMDAGSSNLENGRGGGNEARKVWGYPEGALRLLYDLEEFQQREGIDQDLYSLLPKELLTLQRVAPTHDGEPSPPSVLSEVDGSCSSHFFWMEVLYDFHCGRAQGRDAGEFACADWGTCEPLETESVLRQSRSACAVM